MAFLQEAISREFKRVLADNHLSVTSAARLLGISRQSLHGYLKGTSVPRSQILAIAADLWGFEIHGSKVSFDKQDFGNPASTAPLDQRQLELDLWRKIDAVGENNLRIAFRREGKTLKVDVTIDVPA